MVQPVVRFGVFYRFHYPDSGMAPSDFSTAEPDQEAIPSVTFGLT